MCVFSLSLAAILLSLAHIVSPFGEWEREKDGAFKNVIKLN